MITIAIAEDNPIEMGLLKKAVATHKQWQLQLTAFDGKDLLDKLEKLQLAKLPNILLLDIKMPRLDGLTIAMYCKLKYPSIRIIGVSSHTNENLVREVITEGALGFIAKYFLIKDSILYAAHYKEIDLLEMAVESVMKNQLFIDKLVVNESQNRQLSLATKAIVTTHYKHIKETLLEFAILNSAGLDFKTIGELMCVSVHTIKKYSQQLSAQLKVNNCAELVNYCTAHGIVKVATYFDTSMTVITGWA